MEITGINLYRASCGPAPKEWEEIPEVKEQKPKSIGQEIALQQIDGTNVCLWHTRSFVYWKPYGEPIFIIKKDLSAPDPTLKNCLPEEVTRKESDNSTK